MRAITERIYNDVKFLTSLMPARNYRNTGSLKKAVNYIQNEFQKAGAEAQIQKWEAGENQYENIIASYNAGKERRLVVGAHYDVAGDQPGADDNASAVAGLLELARMVFKSKSEINYQIDFVAYCLEEPPFFGTEEMGSYIHAKSLYDNAVNVIGMICLEMIGYFSDKPNSQSYPSEELAKVYPHTANFIAVVGIEKYKVFNEKVYSSMSKGSGIDVQVVHFPSAVALAGLSDQRNYWKFGYNALMINDTSFVRNPHYHQKSDTIDTLDFKKMTEVINSTYKAVVNM